MKIWWWLIIVLVFVLTGCGSDSEPDSTPVEQAPQATAAQATVAQMTAPQATALPTSTPLPTPTPRPTLTPRDPAPRSRALPPGDPASFEAPLSVGSFKRTALTGNPAAADTGGLQASYQDGDRLIQLTMFHLASPDAALEKVQTQIASNSVIALVDAPFYTSSVAYGTAEMRQGYLIAWSHYEWVYFAYTSGSLEDLQAFMEGFPY